MWICNLNNKKERGRVSMRELTNKCFPFLKKFPSVSQKKKKQKQFPSCHFLGQQEPQLTHRLREKRQLNKAR